MPSSKPTIGINDLASQKPEIAKMLLYKDPEKVFAGSSKTMECWKCECGEIFTRVPQSMKMRRDGSNPNCGCSIYSGSKRPKTKVILGENDLLTTHPNLAKMLRSKDPSTVFGGWRDLEEWECKCGKPFNCALRNATRSKIHHCKDCRNKRISKARSKKRIKLILGKNDLKTTHPNLAKYLHQLDPKTVCGKWSDEVNWICECGEIFPRPLRFVTKSKKKSYRPICRMCFGYDIKIGVNDLQTTHPEIASMAFGWDPRTVHAKKQERPKKLWPKWKCKCGRIFKRKTYWMTYSKNPECSACNHKELVEGVNDLQTIRPDLAEQLYSHNPSKVIAGHNTKTYTWKCEHNHPTYIWDEPMTIRIDLKTPSCAVCRNEKTIKGHNDLKTTHPKIAKEANGWDPTEYRANCKEDLPWRCEECGCEWNVSPSSRTDKRKNTFCPSCSTSGYDPSKNGFMYLMERYAKEQQFGITNFPEDRIKHHESNDWKLIELSPAFSGKLVQGQEKKLKQWLKKTYGNIEGTTENWLTKDFEVRSLSKLYAKAELPQLNA